MHVVIVGTVDEALVRRIGLPMCVVDKPTTMEVMGNTIIKVDVWDTPSQALAVAHYMVCVYGCKRVINRFC